MGALPQASICSAKAKEGNATIRVPSRSWSERNLLAKREAGYLRAAVVTGVSIIGCVKPKMISEFAGRTAT